MSESEQEILSDVEPVPESGSAHLLTPERSSVSQKSAQDSEQKSDSTVVVAGGFMRHHSGPLPAPETLAEYERILPGAAERIFFRFEKQSDHRMAMEAEVIASNTFSQRWSTVLASLVALVVSVGTIFLTYAGRPIAALSFFFATLFSFLGTYVLGKKFQADERRSKADFENTDESDDAASNP